MTCTPSLSTVEGESLNQLAVCGTSSRCFSVEENHFKMKVTIRTRSGLPLHVAVGPSRWSNLDRLRGISSCKVMVGMGSQGWRLNEIFGLYCIG